MSAQAARAWLNGYFLETIGLIVPASSSWASSDKFFVVACIRIIVARTLCRAASCSEGGCAVAIRVPPA